MGKTHAARFYPPGICPDAKGCPMSARQKIWAKEARQELIRLYGGACQNCGALHNLTFDCIRPQGAAHHKLDTSARIAFYRRQHESGNLRLLCRSCNASKSG
jgi:5-methylcytosine-specific restriction endonuclease McrA